MTQWDGDEAATTEATPTETENAESYPTAALMLELTKAKGKLFINTPYEDVYTPLQTFFQTRGTELNKALEWHQESSQPLLKLLAMMNGEFDAQTWKIVTDTMTTHEAKTTDKAFFAFFNNKKNTSDPATQKALFMMVLLSGKVSLDTRQELLTNLSVFVAKRKTNEAIEAKKQEFAQQKDQLLQRTKDMAKEQQQKLLEAMNADQKATLESIQKTWAQTATTIKNSLKERIAKR